jgi:hypothetical protein
MTSYRAIRTRRKTASSFVFIDLPGVTAEGEGDLALSMAIAALDLYIEECIAARRRIAHPSSAGRIVELQPGQDVVAIRPSREVLMRANIYMDFFYLATPATTSQDEKHLRLHVLAGDFALAIETTCADSRERSLALTSLQQAILWADAAIMRHE